MRLNLGCTTRRAWLAGATALAICLAGAPADSLRAEEPSTRPPNVLFVVVDNVGYGDLGCYGNQFNRTPHLDRLATQGVRLTQFYAAAPSCTPSRGALLTGRHPVRTGLKWQLKPEEQLGIGLPLEERIIPAYLKPLGYATAAFGKWNIGFGPGGRPTERGFDEFFGIASGNIDYFHHEYNGRLDTYRGTENVRVEGYATDLWADAACNFIRSQAGRPWFVYLPFNAAHEPNDRNTRPGEKTEWQVPGKYLEQYGWQANEADPARRHAAVLTALDDAIGRVLAQVDDLQLRDKTLVFVMSDNGASVNPKNAANVASNGPLRGGYPTCYEGGIRVPALARWPGQIPGGSVVGEMLSSLDLLPTLVAAAGGTLPADVVFDGSDMRPVLAGGPARPRELYWQFRKFSATCNGSWKLVRPDPQSAWQLYDLKNDPGERNDLASSHPELVGKLAGDFEQWLKTTQQK